MWVYVCACTYTWIMYVCINKCMYRYCGSQNNGGPKMFIPSSPEPVNVILHNKRNFAHVIKDREMRRFSWVIHLDPIQSPEESRWVGQMNVTMRRPWPAVADFHNGRREPLGKYSHGLCKLETASVYRQQENADLSQATQRHWILPANWLRKLNLL